MLFKQIICTFVSAVDKWIKQNRLDFLGIPSCLGFGLHAESYRCENGAVTEEQTHERSNPNLSPQVLMCFIFPRFLVFADMGQSLQAIMEEENELLTEQTVLQLAYRIVSVC